MSRKRILFFEVDIAKQARIEMALRELDVECSFIEKKQYNKKLAELLELPAKFQPVEDYDGPALPAEMIVLAGFADPDIDKFLEDYKNAGIEPINFKAVVTRQNIGWTPVELFNEIFKDAIGIYKASGMFGKKQF